MTKIRIYFLLLIVLLFVVFRTEAQSTSRDTSIMSNQSNNTLSLIMNGNLDAENTFSWDTLPNTRVIAFQPMISLTITNNDTMLLKNPRLVINNRGRWFDLNSINTEAILGANTFNEKAKSVWGFVRAHRIHRAPPSPNLGWGNPVKLLGGYGYMQCGNASALIASLPANERNYFYLHTNYGHASGEIKIANDSALIDADIETFYLKLDNNTLAAKKDVSSDRYLIRRSTHYGKQYRFSDVTNKLIASLYRTEPLINTLYATADVPYPSYDGHTLNFNLRPGESISYEWDDGNYYHTDYTFNALPSEIGNGKFIYRTNFKNAPLPFLINASSNIAVDGNVPNIHADTIGKSSFVIKVTSPFTIVNGTVKGWFYKLTEPDSIEIFFSKDSVNWTSIDVIAGTGNIIDSISLYNDIQPLYSGAPTFSYYLKFVWSPSLVNTDCGIDSLEIQTTFQVSTFFMPHLKLGANQIEYTDQNNDSTDALINFKWQETTSNTPPDKIMNPVFPADGSVTDSLRFNFLWNSVSDSDGDTINNYEFELSDYPDMKYPLSPVFNVYTNTKPYFSHSYWQKINDPGNKTMLDVFKGTQIFPTDEVLKFAKKEADINDITPLASPEFFIPENGLLNAGQTYYWRVRARDSQGAWGEWSNVWSFTGNGVMPPINCTKQITDDTITLSWDANPTGIVPSYYEIHASNEWLGFTPDSSTLLDTTSSENYSFPLNNDSVPDIFYRVIAVDINGKKSGVSEVIQLLYPYYFGKPDTVKTDSVYNLVLNTASLWFPYYNNTLYEGIANDTINKTMLYLPAWLAYDSTTNIINGVADSLIARQMLYDTLLSTIIIKMEGKSSFPHLNPSYVNVIPSLKNTKIIRLKSSCKNNTPYNSFKDTSFIVGTNYHEQIVNGYDMDTLYGDSVSLQVFSKPLWLNEINVSSSSVKLSGTPAANDTGDFIVTILSCDRLNACAVDSFFLVVRMPQLNIPSDSIYICEDDTLVLFTPGESGFFFQWFKDSLTINGATDDSLIVTNAGVYQVQMSADSGMSAFSSSLTVIVDTIKPLINISNDTLSINPVGSSYQWFFQGIIITGANQNIYIALSSGDYFVQIVLPSGCIVYSDTVTMSITTPVIESNAAETMFTAVFNCGNNTLDIFMNNSLMGDVDLKIFNMYGALIKQINFFKNTAAYSRTIHMNDVSAGMYMVSLHSKEKIIHKKIIYGSASR